MRAEEGGAAQPSARSLLVTGASGYVGRKLVEALAREPGGVARIVATDLRAPPEGERLPGVVYETADVRSSDFEALLRRHACDLVVHLAAVVTPGPGSTRAAEYEVDVVGTQRVVAGCLAAGVRALIYTSSGAAYGYHADNPEWLDEEAPLRGNPEFAYADHKRQVEELLARARRAHPELRQLVFRVATILGARADNQITRLFDGRFVLGVAGSTAPFVLIWDEDVVGAILHGIRGGGAGVFNLAGDGTLSLREMARRLGKPYLAVPPVLLALGLRAGRRLGLTAYGPEQLGFLRYRPVLANRRLKNEFGYVPRKRTSEVFDAFVAARQARDRAAQPRSRDRAAQPRSRGRAAR
jgi:UDP-glucose 4-epimerase